jgi:carbon-monoxide dehydrogenase iron sulfur subunit
MKSMIVVSVAKCLGCRSCEMACAVEHSSSKDLYQAIHEAPPPRSRVSVEQGAGFVVPLQCRQCEEAPCMEVCPSDALHRADNESPVCVDHDQCIGCAWCVLVCPFGVISLDSRNRTVIKCDQCFERAERGDLPACVSACPTGALELKDLREVVAEKRRASLVQIRRALERDER